jgi:hypothetical protein
MKGKENLKAGRYELALVHFTFGAGKVTFHFNPIFMDANQVMRTFTQGSDALASFMQIMTGKQLGVVTERTCDQLKGKIILGEILEAKNPKYVNLAKVILVYEEIPEYPYNNSSNTVIEIKTAANDRNRGGSDHAGQTGTDLP